MLAAIQSLLLVVLSKAKIAEIERQWNFHGAKACLQPRYIRGNLRGRG